MKKSQTGSTTDNEYIPVDVFERLLRQRVGWADALISPFARAPNGEQPPVGPQLTVGTGES